MLARGAEGDWAKLTDGFGEEWVANSIAFKPYACGTMTQPYVDCARRLAKKVDVDSIVEVVCEVGEGTVHRLWEPLAGKQAPPNAYAGKFSTPYCVDCALTVTRTCGGENTVAFSISSASIRMRSLTTDGTMVTAEAGFRLMAVAPRTRNIELNGFAQMGEFEYFNDKRKVVGKVGDGGASLSTTNGRGTISLMPR